MLQPVRGAFALALCLISSCTIAGSSGRQVVALGPSPHFAGGSSNFAQQSVASENQLPGTGAWRLDQDAHDGIEGFAGKTSYAPGEVVSLFVRSASHFNVDVYRLGWYHGAGGRLVSTQRDLIGSMQSQCSVLADTLTTECNTWQSNATITIASSWASGLYLAKLSTADHAESYVPFVVREAHPRAPIIVQSSVTTWQAYNLWGGRDLYRGPKTTGPRVAGATGPNVSSAALRGGRALAVSFDRPYEWPGSGQAFLEYPFIYWAESQGLDVAYSTDIDLHEGLDSFNHRKVFVSVGHDEYYSTSMRTSLETALRGGTSLAFIGGNDMYRHIRFAPTELGRDRIEINYRIARDDPQYKINPSEVTTQWREKPLNDPEQQLLGAQWSDGGVNSDWVATGDPAWLFRDTGLHPRDHVKHLVGFEYDHFFPWVAHPNGVVLISSSPVRRGVSANSTFYVSESGAGVFDAGSLWFDCALGPGCHDRSLVPRWDPRPRIDNRVVEDPRIQRLIINLIHAMLLRSFR
ncbi:MAG: N,N-dimethylformamidase beta subunit family domain-containing protein [Actinomycetota bacterium]